MKRTTRQIAFLLALLVALGGCVVSELTNVLRRGQLGWIGRFPNIELEEPPVFEGTLTDPVPMSVHPGAEFDLSLAEEQGLGVFVSDRSGNWDLWAQPLDGSPPQRLLAHPSRESQPAVSPGGDWVAFVSDLVDQKGNIHRVPLKPSQTTDQIFREGHKSEEVIFRANLIESSPQWLTDDLLVFSSKTPEGWRLIAHDWDSGKDLQISTSEVREFSVLQGKRPVIAYLRAGEFGGGGVLWIAPFEFKGDEPLVGMRVHGGAAMEGFPAWGARAEDGNVWLYYSRWMDDTNLDGLINVEDNSSLWRVAVDVDGEKPAPVGLPEPLTGGEAYDVSASPSKSGLFFVRQKGDGVGIMRIPLAGRAAGLRADEEQLAATAEWIDPYERLFGYRWVRRQARESRNRALELRCTFEIAEEFEAVENLAQAMTSYEELVASEGELWPHKAELALVRLEAKILSAASLGDDGEAVVNQEIAGYGTRLQEIAGGSDATLGAEALLSLARIEVDFRRPLLALDHIAQAERRYWTVPETVARARMLRAEIFRARGDEDAFQQELLAITQDYPESPVIRQNAVRRFIKSIEEEASDPRALIERLRQVMAEYPGLSLLQTLGALRIARAYERLQLPHAQQAELEWVLGAEPAGSVLRTTALERLLLQQIKAGNLERIAGLHAQFLAQAKATLSEKEFRMARVRATDAMLARAVKFEESGGRETALAFYEYLARESPENLDAHFGRISLSPAAGRLQLLGEYDNKFDDPVADAAAHYAMALLLLETQKEPDLSDILESHVEPARARYGLDPALHQLRGYVYQINATVYRRRGVGGIEEAIQAYQLALVLCNTSPRQARRRTELQVALGNAFMNFSPPNYERAHHYYQQYLAGGRVFEDAVREMALRERMARAAFHAGAPAIGAAHAKRGAALAGSLGREPLRDRMLSYEAMCLQELGRHEEAVEALLEVESASGAKPRSAKRNRILRNLAYNRYQIGARVEALENLQEGRSILQDSSVKFASSSAETRGFSSAASEEALGFSRKGEMRLNLTYAGQIHEELGDTAKAIDLQRGKLALFDKPEKERGDEALSYHNRLGIGWNRIARLEYSREAFAAAAQALRVSLTHAGLSRQARGEVFALSGLLRALLVGEGEPSAQDVTQMEAVAGELIRLLDERLAKGLSADWLLLARLHHCRALLRLVTEESFAPSLLAETIEDFEAAVHAFAEVEALTGEGHSSERLSVQLNEVAFFQRVGFSTLAGEKLDQIDAVIENYRFHCLGWHAWLLRDLPGDTGALVRDLETTPPALCIELSGEQLRATYKRLLERLLAVGKDPVTIGRLLELRSQLLLAADFVKGSRTFVSAEDQALAGSVERAMGDAREKLQALHRFWLVEGSLGSEGELARLRAEADRAVTEAKLATEQAARANRALARLYLPVPVSDGDVSDALERAGVLRFTAIGSRLLIWARIAGHEPVVIDSIKAPRSGITDQEFAGWYGRVLKKLGPPFPARGGTYVIADGALAALPWGVLERGAGGGALSQAGSLAGLTLAWEHRNANKGRGMLVARTDARNEAEISARFGWLEGFHEKLAEKITGLRGFYFSDNTVEELAGALSDPTAQYHFLYVMAPLRLEPGLPLAGAIDLWSSVGGNSLPVGAWTKISAQANLAVFANVTGGMDGRNFAALSYLSALAGMPSVILVRRNAPLELPAAAELAAYIEMFERVLPDGSGGYARASDAAAALAASPAMAGLDVRFVGYLGMDAAEARRFAQQRLNALAAATIGAVQAGRLSEAAASSEKAIVLMDVVGAPPRTLLEMLNVAVFTHKKAGMLERATKYEERQVRVLEQGGISEPLVHVLFFLGRDQLALGSFEEATQTLQRSQEAARRLARTDLEIVVLSELAKAQEGGGNAPLAMESLRSGLALSETAGDSASQEEFHYNIGRVAHSRLHDEALAASHLDAALTLARSLGEGARRNAARDALTLVLVEQQRGRLESALGTLADLIPWARGLGDDELLSQGLVYEAIVWRKLGDPGRAEDILARAETIAQSAGATKVLADIRNAHVLIRLDQGRLEDALAEAKSLAAEPHPAETSLAAHHNLALVSLELGDLAGARKALGRAQELAKQVGEPLAIADELLLEARLLRAQPESAKKALEKLGEAARAYQAAGHESRRTECEVAMLEWSGAVQRGTIEELLAATQRHARDDLRWRVLGRMGSVSEGAALYLRASPVPDPELERRGLDPVAGLNLVREQVAVLAARGESEAALALWEQGLARRRRSLLAAQPLSESAPRGGKIVSRLLRTWAEIRARRYEPKPGRESLAELESREAELFAQLAREDAPRAAYLQPDAALLKNRRAELRGGDRILLSVSAAARTWFFVVGGDSVDGFVLEMPREELAGRSASLGELLSSMARYGGDLGALHALLPEGLRTALQGEGARLFVIGDQSTQSLPLHLVLGIDRVAYRASLAAPLYARAKSAPLSVLALGEVPAALVGRKLPPRVEGRPTPWQGALWDQEIFELLETAAVGRYVSLPAALSGASEWRPRQHYDALWCAAAATPGRRVGGVCGSGEGAGIALGALAGQRALPGMLVLPGYRAEAARGWDFALWIEWVMDGRPVILGTERLPVSGASYGKYLVRALAKGDTPAAAHWRSQDALRRRWPHPAHWSGFFYYGPMN